MAIMEITIIPKTSDLSVSKYIAQIIQYLEDNNIEYKLTPMSTIIEGDIDYLFEVAKNMHKVPVNNGFKRVYTIIKIDDRYDKKITMDGKVNAVMSKLKKNGE